MNAFKTVLTLFMAFGMVSCHTNEAKIPPNILSDHAMIPIMVDIHVVEGARNGALILGDTNGIEDYYDKIYSKHQTRMKIHIYICIHHFLCKIRPNSKESRGKPLPQKHATEIIAMQTM